MEELGRGGMGVVYRAVDQRTGQQVALKHIQAGSWADEPGRLAARLGRELEALNRLDHPGIVSAHDAGWISGRFFVAMELVEGETLAARLARHGPLDPRDAAELLLDLADAVHHAHQRGVLHRDIKPENILIGPQGRPRLTDLGLAQLEDQQARLTRTGAAVGTPGFCAPEQLGSSAITSPTVDVYGLGATLYAALTGHAPFEAPSTYEVAVLTVERKPVPPSKHPEGPSDSSLDSICLRCLSKEPGERFVSPGALAEELERYLTGPQPSALPFGALAGVAGVVLLLAAVYLLISPSPPPEIASASPGGETTPSRGEGSPSVSATRRPGPPPRREPPVTRPSASGQPQPRPAPSRSSPAVPEVFIDVRPTQRDQATAPRRVEDLASLGPIGALFWRARNKWKISRRPDGFVLLGHPDPKSLSHVYVSRSRADQLSASVEIEARPGPPGTGMAFGALLYGDLAGRNYLIAGFDRSGKFVILHRHPKGLSPRVASGPPPQGVYRVGIRELPDRRVAVELDGRRRMSMGGIAGPRATVGLGVLGEVEFAFRGFKLSYEER